MDAQAHLGGHPEPSWFGFPTILNLNSGSSASTFLSYLAEYKIGSRLPYLGLTLEDLDYIAQTLEEFFGAGF